MMNLSIYICTYHEEDNIHDCINSIVENGYKNIIGGYKKLNLKSLNNLIPIFIPSHILVVFWNISILILTFF